MRDSESRPAALSESETESRADLSTVFGASHDTFRRHRFLGVGGSGRSPLESADPQVRRAASWSKQGGRKLRKQYRGGVGLGLPPGAGAMALHRWNAWNAAYGRCFRRGARDGGFGTTFRGAESPPAALSEPETGYRADHSTVFGASHDTFRRHRLLGVGGSGRSPLESADPFGSRRDGRLKRRVTIYT